MKYCISEIFDFCPEAIGGRYGFCPNGVVAKGLSSSYMWHFPRHLCKISAWYEVFSGYGGVWLISIILKDS